MNRLAYSIALVLFAAVPLVCIAIVVSEALR